MGSRRSSRAPGSQAGWIALGAAGSLLTAAAACTVLSARPVRWWVTPSLPGGHGFHIGLLYGGLVALSIAWLGMGRQLLRGRRGCRGVLAAAALWALPLALGPALFSRDAYSYLAQGLILHLGLNPYVHGPAVLAGLGHAGVVSHVSPFWRHTPAPYGPGFLGLAALVAAAAASHPVAAVLLLRVPELAGLALLARFVPRLARRLGAEPSRALWLVLACPLTLVELVGAGHNDALMAGLLVAGVTLALERRELTGIALCALAATVKYPAALGVVALTLAWMRGAPERGMLRLVAAAAVSAAVLAGVSLLSGAGSEWVSSGFLSTAAKVHLAITPATALGYVVARVLHLRAHPVEDALARVTLALAVAWALWLLVGVRRKTLVPRLGGALLLLVVGGPALWPWYLLWGLSLLCGWPVAQRSRGLAALLVAPVFLIDPGGQLLISIGAAPWVLLILVLAGALRLRAAARRAPLLARSRWRRSVPAAPLSRS